MKDILIVMIAIPSWLYKLVALQSVFLGLHVCVQVSLNAHNGQHC